jgi:hypothetical protein
MKTNKVLIRPLTKTLQKGKRYQQNYCEEDESTSKTTNKTTMKKKKKELAKLLARPPSKNLQQDCTLVRIERPHKFLLL